MVLPICAVPDPCRLHLGQLLFCQSNAGRRQLTTKHNICEGRSSSGARGELLQDTQLISAYISSSFQTCRKRRQAGTTLQHIGPSCSLFLICSRNFSSYLTNVFLCPLGVLLCLRQRIITFRYLQEELGLKKASGNATSL